jgi:hypothetical protein
MQIYLLADITFFYEENILTVFLLVYLEQDHFPTCVNSFYVIFINHILNKAVYFLHVFSLNHNNTKVKTIYILISKNILKHNAFIIVPWFDTKILSHFFSSIFSLFLGKNSRWRIFFNAKMRNAKVHRTKVQRNKD